MMKTIFVQGQQWPTSQPIQHSKGEFIIIIFPRIKQSCILPNWEIAPDWIHHEGLPPARPFDFCTSTFLKNPSQSIRQDIVGSCLPQNQNKQARIPQNGRLGQIFVYEVACIYSKSEIDLQWYRQQPEWRRSSSPIFSSFLSPLM